MGNDKGNSRQRGVMDNVSRSLRLGVVGVLLLGACGVAEDDTPTHSSAQTKTESFLVWDPGTALVNEHTQWHLGSCGAAGSRRCPASGEEFLTFHRNFLDRLRDEFERQGISADITPWIQLPPEMRNPANGWTAALQTAEDHIWSMIAPATGVRFSTLEAYGTYIEQNYHNFLHGIAAAAYGESAIGPINMSPKSTYFFKIHGLVELHFQRFQRGDFNKDGFSDIFDRNTTTGVNQIWYMNGTNAGTKNTITPVGVDGCNWYVGAVTDINYDGMPDLVWHGPGCGATSVWIMNGLTLVSGVTLPGVGSDWTLVGAGDFNGDLRPDLVWRSNTSQLVSIWEMNSGTLVANPLLTMPAGYSLEAVADVTDNGIPDLILKNQPSPGTFRYNVLYMLGNAQMGSLFTLSNTGGTTSLDKLAGTGRFQSNGVSSDLLFVSKDAPPATTSRYSFAVWSSSVRGSTTFTRVTGAVLPAGDTFQGPR